jgi:hypothetical protein
MDPRRFGRAVVARPEALPAPAPAFSADLRLFAITFAAGFLFVSILIG